MPTTMVTRNELTIRGPEQELAQLLERLSRLRVTGWKRDADAEARLSGTNRKGTATRCFACDASDGRPAAALWLQARGPSELYVADVVPLRKRELSDDEYNRILSEFKATVLPPAWDGLNVETELVLNRVTPEAYLSPEGIRRLNAFAVAANMTLLQESDCRRWQEFIVQSHVDGADLDPSLLDQWLADQHWPEETRRELVCEYETSRSILRTYDQERLEKCLP